MPADADGKPFDAVLMLVIETLGELANRHIDEVEELKKENLQLRTNREELSRLKISSQVIKPSSVGIDIVEPVEDAECLPEVAREPRPTEPALGGLPSELERGSPFPPAVEEPDDELQSQLNSLAFLEDTRNCARSLSFHEFTEDKVTFKGVPTARFSKLSGQSAESYRTHYVTRKIWSDQMDKDRLKLSEMYGYSRRYKGTTLAAKSHRYSLHDLKATTTTTTIGQASTSTRIGTATTTTTVTTSGDYDHGFYGRLSILVINPHSVFRAVWLVACVVFLCYDVVMLPVDFGFNLEASVTRDLINLAAVLFWTMDMPMNFLTGIVTPASVDMRPKKTCEAYLRGWFGFDLFLVVQDWLGVATENSSALSALSLGQGVRFARIMRLLRLIRLVRIARLRPVLRVFLLRFGFDLNVAGVHAISLWTYLVVVLCITIHFQTCLWHAVGDLVDQGWVTSNELGEPGIAQRYVVSLHWTCSRLHGMSYSYHFDSTAERLGDSLLIIWSLLILFIFSGQLTAITMALVTSQGYSLRKLAHTYVRRHGISLVLYNRLTKFLRASQIDGVATVLSDEVKLLKELPPALREDLLYEARMVTVRRKIIFDDMWYKNPRVIRHVCNQAMLNQIAVEEETLFAIGDAGTRMLFVTSGSLRYKCSAKVKLGTNGCETAEAESYPAQPLSPKGLKRALTKQIEAPQDTSEHNPGQVMITKRTSVSEACLWTAWEHPGSLVASQECLLLALDAHLFGDVILQHHEACVHSVKYAKRYVWNLNNQPQEMISDLLDMPSLTWRNLDEDLIVGGEEDHYIFISHYKVEAGTEATLLRDSFEEALQDDPQHPAHFFLSPFFIDSEDLEDLTRLKAHVEKTTALVLLLTPGVLSRPWCLVELVTACRMGVNIVPVEVQRPGCRYQFPDEEFYERLLKGHIVSDEGVGLLESEGMSMEEVESAIRQVFKKIAISFSPHKSKTVRSAEIQDILRRCGTQAIGDHVTQAERNTHGAAATSEAEQASARGSTGGWFRKQMSILQLPVSWGSSSGNLNS